MFAAHFAGDAHISIGALFGARTCSARRLRYRRSGGAQVERVPDEIRFAGGPPEHARRLSS
jgi:hypothetical protein